ncbi:MAG: hypothetical protein EOO22_05555, partial [Comamonadaceae bacterium]
MTPTLASARGWLTSNGGVFQRAAAPLLVISILALMVLPIPPWMLDGFFTLNIAVALMVMMVAAYMVRPRAGTRRH